MEIQGMMFNVKQFLIDRRSRSLSKSTLEYYERELRFFSEYLAGRGISDVGSITSEHIRSFMIELQKKRNSGGVHAMYRAIKVFLKWWERETEPPNWHNPMNKINPPKPEAKPIEGISLEDFKKMLLSCGNDSHGKRDRAILMTLLDTGCRVSEFCNIKIEDVNFGNSTITIHGGKGNKSRYVFVGNQTQKEIIKYLRTRPDAKPDEPLFITRSGTAFTRKGFDSVLLKHSQLAGISFPSPHDFRRASAINMLRRGVDVISVSRILGHATLEITERYLAQTSEDLHDAYEKGSPVDNLNR